MVCFARLFTRIIANGVSERSILFLFLGDATRDRRVQSFSRYFKAQGWKVEVIAIQPNVTRGPRKFLEYHRRVKNETLDKRADVVMACDLYSLFAAAAMKKSGRAKVLLYDARELYTELPSVANRPIAKFVWRRQERRGMLLTDLIIVTAPRDANAILRVHNFLPRPVLVRNLPWLEPELVPDRSALRRLGIPADAKTLVYLGGLQQGRGLEKLLEAMNSVPYHVVLIGYGNLRSGLEAQSSKNIHFAGSMQLDEALRVAAACDVGISLIEPISPSYALALPSKVFEYMMCGVPVVSSQLSQVLDLFPSEDWITYVDEKDVKSIVTGIQKAIAISARTDIREHERSLACNDYHFGRDAASLMNAVNHFLD